jgi:hypothetical protein
MRVHGLASASELRAKACKGTKQLEQDVTKY